MASGELAYDTYRPLIAQLVDAVRNDVRYAETFAVQSSVQSNRRNLKRQRVSEHVGKKQLADV